ncbi:MAG: hypothetical protein ACOYJ2_07420 [Rickettsiales bacterium]
MKSSRFFPLILILFVALLGGFVVYQQYHAQRGDSESLWFTKNNATKSTIGNEPILKEWRVTINSDQHTNEPRGTVFEWKSKDGALQCGAGFVYSIGSHAFSNQNQLEFWCHDAKQKPLTFTTLPRPKSDFPQSYVGNINGELYDYTTHRVFDFDWNVWREISKQDWTDIGGAVPYVFQITDKKPIVIATDYKNCGGLSLFSPKGYVGTLPTGTDFSSAIIWRGALYANVNRQIWRAQLPTSTHALDGQCHPLTYDIVSNRSDWAYTFFPLEDTLYYGGSVDIDGGKRNACARLNRWDEATKQFVPQPITIDGESCEGENITEYYSFTPYQKGGLVGNFPHGGLVYHDGTKAAMSKLALATKDDFGYENGTFYRESQTVLSAYGNIFVGMFPWAEFFAINPETDTSTIQRLITHPEKARGEAPYMKDAPMTAGNVPDPTHWGQRITRVTVLNGKLCASTGNKRGKRYSAAEFPNLTEEETLDYGKVFCATLPNHTMAAHQIAAKGTLRFVVGKNHLMIFENDRLIAYNTVNLTPQQRQSLDTDDGELTKGTGNYGAFKGVLKF